MKLTEPQAFNTIDKLKNISIVFIGLLIYTFGIFELISFILDIPSNSSSFERPFKVILFFGVILAPIWEELAYRVIPITIAKNLGKEYILPIIALSSIIFGWNHGLGTVSLLIQGVGGFVISILYIKNNYSYWSVVLFHMIWNFTHYFILN